MTLEQLKSLKVGDVVRYTNKEDATDCTDWRVDKISTNYVDFIDMGKNGNYMLIYFNDQDIQHIASTLAFVPPTTTNEIQIILHQIRDAEFDLRMAHEYYLNRKSAKEGWMEASNICEDTIMKLLDLRKKRDNLLKQNI